MTQCWIQMLYWVSVVVRHRAILRRRTAASTQPAHRGARHGAHWREDQHVAKPWHATGRAGTVLQARASLAKATAACSCSACSAVAAPAAGQRVHAGRQLARQRHGRRRIRTTIRVGMIDSITSRSAWTLLRPRLRSARLLRRAQRVRRVNGRKIQVDQCDDSGAGSATSSASQADRQRPGVRVRGQLRVRLRRGGVRQLADGA